MKIFNSLDHAWAWVVSKITAAAPKVAAVAQEVAAVAESPIGQFIASAAGSKGAAVQADIEAIAGSVLASATATGAAVGANGLNVSFDENALAALERLIGTVGGLFGKTVAAK